MQVFYVMYNERKEEIEGFFKLMSFLEEKEMKKDSSGLSEFDHFFNENNTDEFNYQSLINIFKSNVSLMIYNIIEFTVSNLIEGIYDEIKKQHLSYNDVSASIKTLWRKTILKEASDPNASFNTFLRKNEEIIDAIISNSTIEMTARKTISGGNLDAEIIKDTFEAHGIKIVTSSPNYRPDIFRSIKDKRNNLAHGSVSFIEAVREESIQDIKRDKEIVILFLDELIAMMEEYITKREFIAK